MEHGALVRIDPGGHCVVVGSSPCKGPPETRCDACQALHCVIGSADCSGAPSVESVVAVRRESPVASCVALGQFRVAMVGVVHAGARSGWPGGTTVTIAARETLGRTTATRALAACCRLDWITWRPVRDHLLLRDY